MQLKSTNRSGNNRHAQHNRSRRDWRPLAISRFACLPTAKLSNLNRRTTFRPVESKTCSKFYPTEILVNATDPKNPFAEPLVSEPAGTPDSHLTRAMRPLRLERARQAILCPLTILFFSYLSWLLLLGFIFAVTLFESFTGESSSRIGQWTAHLVAWTDGLSPYNYLLAAFSGLLSAAGLFGIANGMRQQNLQITRWSAHLSYLPILGPWLGIQGWCGIWLLLRLRRQAIRRSFDTG